MPKFKLTESQRKVLAPKRLYINILTTRIADLIIAKKENSPETEKEIAELRREALQLRGCTWLNYNSNYMERK